MCQYLTVDDALPLDTEDASEASQTERVQTVFLSHVANPSFSGVE